jgi:hypothetical protein
LYSIYSVFILLLVIVVVFQQGRNNRENLFCVDLCDVFPNTEHETTHLSRQGYNQLGIRSWVVKPGLGGIITKETRLYGVNQVEQVAPLSKLRIFEARDSGTCFAIFLELKLRTQQY